LDYSNIRIYNLPPQSTAFVGRQSELFDIVSRFQDENCRLLTLVGSGGTGKTRLAIESIQHLIESDFEHGVFYVPLAPLTSADSIVTTIINILSIVINEDGTPKDELLKFLSQRNLLLVMDNFEHVLEGVDIVADILKNTDRVKILATSRETLNLSIEHVWHVRGMRYPDTDEPEDINQYDALTLFVERAMQIRRDFSPSDEQIAIIQICQQVDGLPLAIELAAGWLKTLSCTGILKQIEQGIDFLATRNRDVPERHGSIRAVFNHSWDLLSTDEKAVFPRLAVFRGGFTLEAAKHVANADLMVLSGLVDKSMVRRDYVGRYDLHELMRQYAEERLQKSSEVNATNKHHSSYFADFMMNRTPDLKGRRQVESLNEIHVDFDNIYTAWRYACHESLYDELDQMIEGIFVFFDIARHPPISKDIYQYALSNLDSSTNIEHLRLKNYIKVLYLYSTNLHTAINRKQVVHETQQCLESAEGYGDQLTKLLCVRLIELHRTYDIQETLALSESIGDPYYICTSLDFICFHYAFPQLNCDDVALYHINRYRDIAREIGNVDAQATAYSHLLQRARYCESLEQMQGYIDQATRLYQQTKNQHGLLICRGISTMVQFRLGNLSSAEKQLTKLLDDAARIGWQHVVPYAFTSLGRIAAISENYTGAQQHLTHALEYSPDPHIRFQIMMCLALCLIGLHDIDSARQYIANALEADFVTIHARITVDYFPTIALIYHHDNQYVKAVELLGLTFSHPLGITMWMDRWKLLDQLKIDLKAKLGEEAYQIAWERGQELDLTTTIDTLKAELEEQSATNMLSESGIATPISTANQALTEPLTEREIEVLNLLGEGLSNRNIADQLTVTVGTVKSHVHNLCQKLDAKNRTQALLEAKKLGLL
jgi:predicted ATPase/DNA-binding CsgD family transcriptional regulator